MTMIEKARCLERNVKIEKGKENDGGLFLRGDNVTKQIAAED